MALLPVLAALTQLVVSVPTESVPEVRVEREAWLMGTRFHLLAHGPSEAAAGAAAETALREVERLEGLLSTWDASTETSRLNRAPVGEPVRLPPELHALLSEATAWGARTGGAFEPVVGALIDAWDLRGAGRVPDAPRLVRALEATGSPALVLDARGGAARLEEEAWLDTGGFGKGAALRSAAALLRKAGVERARLDLGGQLHLLAPEAEPWTVPVAHPERREEAVLELRLRDVSVATSGTSERHVEVEGRRFGHILDPRTGRPAPAWGTVTVVHRDALAADVLATALYVMGPEEGMRWLEAHPEIAALFLEIREGRAIPSWTGAMEPWLHDPDAAAGSDPGAASSLHRPF